MRSNRTCINATVGKKYHNSETCLKVRTNYPKDQIIQLWKMLRYLTCYFVYYLLCIKPIILATSVNPSYKKQDTAAKTNITLRKIDSNRAKFFWPHDSHICTNSQGAPWILILSRLFFFFFTNLSASCSAWRANWSPLRFSAHCLCSPGENIPGPSWLIGPRWRLYGESHLDCR